MASNLLYQETDVNLIVAGPPGTGKKTFIQALCNSSVELPEEDISSVYNMSFDVYGKSIVVTVWYVRNLEKSVEQMKLICSGNSSSVILFWYAIDDPRSLKTVTKDYITKLRHLGRFYFLSVLVGNKLDLRQEASKACLNPHHGLAVKTCFQLGSFIECSAKSEYMARCVFIRAVFTALGLDND